MIQEENILEAQKVIEEETITIKLTNKNIDFNSPISTQDQAVQIALYDLFKKLEFYGNVVLKHGQVEPFVNTFNLELMQANELHQISTRNNIAIPENDCIGNFDAHDDYVECLELGLSYELKTIKLFDKLLPYIQDDSIRDCFFRIQASSYNNSLPAFRKALKNKYISDNMNNNQIIDELNEYGATFQKIASGEANPEEITSILDKVGLPLIGGMIVGGAATSFLTQFLKKQEDSEE